jgi:pimeloyl-ACP methyl ester carboxylesterase
MTTAPTPHYRPKNLSQSLFVPLRGQNYHVRQWGTPQTDRPPLVLVHGWMDVSASYQFMVDALQQNHWILAPDWRGFGETTGPFCDHYVFPDYLADLDFLLDTLVGDRPIHLVGHSMGGNIAMMYSGIRPERIRRLVNLEGFGMPQTLSSQAPTRYAKWMDELKSLQRGEMALKTYPDLAAVAARLVKTNPRLSQDKALWLAGHWSEEIQQADGIKAFRIRGEAAHKVVNSQLFKVEELLALYQRIQAPVLMVEASDDSLSQWWKGQFDLAQFHERLAQVPQCRIEVVPDSGHMLHHDQPEWLAKLIETFLAE